MASTSSQDKPTDAPGTFALYIVWLIVLFAVIAFCFYVGFANE